MHGEEVIWIYLDSLDDYEQRLEQWRCECGDDVIIVDVEVAECQSSNF
jgi:hypothetical protein